MIVKGGHILKRLFQKLSMSVAVLVGLLLMSVTVCAFYVNRFEVNVSKIQTAKFEVLVSVVPKEAEGTATSKIQENYLESYTFSGEEGESGVCFCITAAGTASTGYCKVMLNEQSFFTEAISVEESKVITVKGNAGDVVRFEAYWGSHGITDEALLLNNESVIGTYNVTASPSPSPSPNPSASPSISPSPEPTSQMTATPTPTIEPTLTPTSTVEPTSTPEVTPEPTPTVEPTSTPEVMSEPTPTMEPTPTPEVTSTPTSEEITKEQ